MGYYRGQASAMLLDSQQHGPEAELLLVEGESAAQSVAAVRQSLRQAVLPLQGKPLNAWKAGRDKVLASPLYRQLAAALGLPDAVSCSDADVGRLRYGRILLLFDPDADGIHIGATLDRNGLRPARYLVTEDDEAEATDPTTPQPKG